MGTDTFYGSDLAHAHAQGFSAYWSGAADWLAQRAKDATDQPFVVDVGCGDGTMLAELEQRGVRGRGFDISESFVDAARQRGLDVSVADAASLSVPRASLVIALGEVLAYENGSGEIALDNIAQSAAATLIPGGSLVFDITTPDMVDVIGWRDEDDWLVASRTDILAQNRLARTIVTFRRDGDRWRRSDETHYQRLVEPAYVQELADRLGLELELVRKVGETQMLPGRIGCIARKPVA